ILPSTGNAPTCTTMYDFPSQLDSTMKRLITGTTTVKSRRRRRATYALDDGSTDQQALALANTAPNLRLPGPLTPLIRRPEIRGARSLSANRPVGSDLDAGCSAPSEE